MRLITWACLLSISRGCVASPVICTEYRNISFQSAVVVRLKWIAIQQCRNLNTSPLTIVRRHLYKMYINYDSLDQHMALEMKWMLNCIEPFPYAAWAYNNSPAFGLRNIAYDLSLDSAGLHLPVSISFESLYLQISLSPAQWFTWHSSAGYCSWMIARGVSSSSPRDTSIDTLKWKSLFFRSVDVELSLVSSHLQFSVS